MGEQIVPSLQSRFLVLGTVSFYMVAALAMVVANKWVLDKISVPSFYLLIQLLIAVVLFLAVHFLGLIKVSFYLDWPLCKGLAPTVLLNVIGLSFSNLTLKYVDGSFYQVARGLVLPFTVLTSFILLSSRPSLYALVACAIVTMGFFVGVFLDGVQVSQKGVILGVLSSMVTALHAVAIKRAIKLLNDSALNLGWYTNLLSTPIFMAVVVLSGEIPGIMELFSSSSQVLHPFLWGSAITGSVGFLMSIASLLSIKVTSPITHMISSAVRGVAATFLCVWFFEDVITSGRAASIAIILGGSIYYTWIKNAETQRSEPHVKNSDKTIYEPVPLEDLEAGGSTDGKRTRPE